MSDICPCALGLEVVVEQPLVRFFGVDELVLAAEQHANLGPMGSQPFREARLDGPGDDGGIDQPGGGACVAGEKGGHPPAHAGPDKGVAWCGERLRPRGFDAFQIAVVDGGVVEVPTEAGEVGALAAGTIAFEPVEKAAFQRH